MLFVTCNGPKIVEADEALRKAVLYSIDKRLDSWKNIVQPLDSWTYTVQPINTWTLYYHWTVAHIHCPSVGHLDIQWPIIVH